MDCCGSTCRILCAFFYCASSHSFQEFRWVRAQELCINRLHHGGFSFACRLIPFLSLRQSAWPNHFVSFGQRMDAARPVWQKFACVQCGFIQASSAIEQALGASVLACKLPCITDGQQMWDSHKSVVGPGRKKSRKTCGFAFATAECAVQTLQR